MPATGWSSIATGELEVSMLAETAVTGVAKTTLTPGLDVEPVSLALNYFRLTRPAGNLLARARVVNASRLFVFVETEIEDPNGRKVAHGTSHCEVRRVELSPPPPPSELRRVDEAAYSTPDPYLRAVRSRLAPPEMLAEQGGLAFLQAYLQGRFLTPFSELTGCRIDADGQLAASAHASAQLIDSSKRQKQTVSEVKRILATLLFTDIVGSTEHARRLGDGGWRAVLSQHHNAVRCRDRAVRRHRGRHGWRRVLCPLRFPGARARLCPGSARGREASRHRHPGRHTHWRMRPARAHADRDGGARRGANPGTRRPW